MANAELLAINAVIANKDIGTLYEQPGADELFPAYGDVVQFIKDYYTKYQATPDYTVVEQQFDDFDRVEVGGQTAHYFDQLVNAHIDARIDAIMTAAAKAKDSGELPPKAVLAKMEQRLSALNKFASGATDANIMDFDAAEKHYEEVAERAAAMGGVPGIRTGIDFIDSAYTSGLAPGDLVVVLGWTGRAKSLFTTAVSCNAHDCDFLPMIVTLEMSAAKVRDRVFTIKGSGLFKNSKLALGEVTAKQLSDFKDKQAEKPDFIVVTNEGVSELTPNIVESKIDQHHPKIVTIDYAQLASDNANSQNMTDRMRNMSKEYKRLAVKKGVVIILISSATPDSSKSTAEPPMVEDVAWSKQLAYDADLSFAVHKMDDSDLIKIVCRKNRNGPLFAGMLDWDIDNGIIKEV